MIKAHSHRLHLRGDLRIPPLIRGLPLPEPYTISKKEYFPVDPVLINVSHNEYSRLLKKKSGQKIEKLATSNMKDLPEYSD